MMEGIAGVLLNSGHEPGVVGGGPERSLAPDLSEIAGAGVRTGLSLPSEGLHETGDRWAKCDLAGLSLLGLHRCVDDARVGRVPKRRSGPGRPRDGKVQPADKRP
jgi:hypothetical protein